MKWAELYASLSILCHCPSVGLQWKLTFHSPVTTAEFSKFADMLSTVSYSSWGHKESETTEQITHTHTHTHTHLFKKKNLAYTTSTKWSNLTFLIFRPLTLETFLWDVIRSNKYHLWRNSPKMFKLYLTKPVALTFRLQQTQRI